MSRTSISIKSIQNSHGRKRKYSSTDRKHFSHHQKISLFGSGDFFLEVVSNAIDATSKLQTLSSKGIAKGELGDLTIDILVDEDKKTVTIRDRGIDLSAEEARKYLNQVALSSAQEFIEKFKGETNIIGHFWTWVLFRFYGGG